MSDFNFGWVNQVIPNKQDLTIFDIGSFNFSDSIRFKNYFPNAKVYGIEADKFNYDTYYQSAQDSGVSTHFYAITDKTGEVTFYPSRKISFNNDDNHDMWTCSGSILKPIEAADPRIKYDMEGITVPSIRLDEFCKENNIEEIDVIHMDVQGNEYWALKGLGDNSKLYPKILYCETYEFHTYESGLKLEDLDNLLFEMGYKIGARLQFDTLYIKND
jgi:FkbM family methyltransferase